MPSLHTAVNEYNELLMKLFTFNNNNNNNNNLPLIKTFTVNNNSLPLTRLFTVNNNNLPLTIYR